MKRIAIGLLVVLMLAATPMAGLADTPAPGGPFNTAFRVQNLGTAVAHCALSFYNASGVEATNMTLPDIAVGDSAFVYVPGVAGLTSGQYTGVVSCDQDVAAVVNFSDSNSGASYSGFNQAGVANTLFAPAIYDSYFNYFTNVVVQNASGSPINITLDIFAPGQTAAVYSETKTAVPANAAVNFEQEGKTQLNTNQAYSAKITGTGAIAAVVNIYGRGAVNDQLYSYDAFSSGSTVAYAPVIMSKFFGYNTALVIQNMDTAAADVRITYGTGLVKTTTIQPGAADSRYTPGEGLPDATFTGAKIESINGK